MSLSIVDHLLLFLPIQAYGLPIQAYGLPNQAHGLPIQAYALPIQAYGLCKCLHIFITACQSQCQVCPFHNNF